MLPWAELIEAEWRIYRAGKLAIIGSDHGVSLVGAKP